MSERNEMGQFAQVPTWVLGYLSEKFPHPASYGRALRTYALFAAAARDGRILKPTRLEAIRRKTGYKVSRRALERGAQKLANVGLLARLHQAHGNLRTASTYVLAISPEQVDRLEQCGCRKCVEKRLQESHTASSPVTSDAVTSVTAAAEGDVGSSDHGVVHISQSVSQNTVDDHHERAEHEEQTQPSMEEQPTASPTAAAPPAPEGEGDTTATSQENNNKSNPHSPQFRATPLAPDPRFEAMIRQFLFDVGRPMLPPADMDMVRAAYEAHPAGLRWVLNDTYGTAWRGADVGLLLAKLRQGQHLAKLTEYYNDNADATAYLCGDCEGTGYWETGELCTCRGEGWLCLKDTAGRPYHEVEQEHGVRIMRASSPRQPSLEPAYYLHSYIAERAEDDDDDEDDDQTGNPWPDCICNDWRYELGHMECCPKYGQSVDQDSAEVS